MKAVVLFYESQETITFSHPLIGSIKSNFPSLTTFDLDQNSSAEIFSYAEQLLKEAEEFVLVADTGSAGKIMTLTEQVIKRQNQAAILFLRPNPLFNMLLKTVPSGSLFTSSDPEEQMEFIKNVLKLQ